MSAHSQRHRETHKRRLGHETVKPSTHTHTPFNTFASGVMPVGGAGAGDTSQTTTQPMSWTTLDKHTRALFDNKRVGAPSVGSSPFGFIERGVCSTQPSKCQSGHATHLQLTVTGSKRTRAHAHEPYPFITCIAHVILATVPPGALRSSSAMSIVNSLEATAKTVSTSGTHDKH